jgi:hypothetical protein
MALPCQTYYAKGKPLFQPFGTTPPAVSTFTTASISSLNVSSINGIDADQIDAQTWSFFPAVNPVSMDGNPIVSVGPFSIGIGPAGSEVTNATFGASGDVSIGSYIQAPSGLFTSTTTEQANVSSLQASTVNGVIGSFSTINTSTITANTVVALSTINAVSTISTTVVDAQAITNLSSINGLSLSTLAGASDWSLFPAVSTVNMGGYDMINVADLYSESNQPIYITTNGNGGIFFRTSNADAFQLNPDQTAKFFSDVEIDGTISTNAILVSTINGIEFVGGGGGSLTLSSIATEAFSTIGASIQQGLMSSIVFNPQINPQFNIDLGMGNFLTTLGTGLFGVAVAVPTTVGTLTYGITKGLASLFEPKPVINNIAVTSSFEVFNYASQLQISTLGHYVSTIYSFVSTIPSTVVINDQPTFSTVSSIDLPFFFSTLSESSTPTCIRALADPTQTISTPWTYSQSLPDWSWVELPSSIAGGGGGGSNFSTLSLSTLTLAPSTILQSEPSIGGILRVLEPDLVNLGQLEIQGVNIKNDINTATDGIYTGLTGTPYWIDQNFSSFVIAYDKKAPTEFFVATNGSDTTGTGSFNNPFKTIQAGITAGEAVSSSANQVVIQVAPGQYTENITFSVGYVSLVGVMNTQDGNQITNLNGNITVNVGVSDDLVGRQVILQGLQIDGVLTDTSPNQHSLLIQDCKFFATNTLLLVNPTATNQRTFITNTEFVQTGAGSTLPVIDVREGQLQLERIDVDNSTNNTILMSVSGDASVARCNLCNFESGTTATTTAQAIISVSSTSPLAHSFGYTNIYYGSASNKSGSATATGILFTSATTMTAIVIGCVFSLVGTTDLLNNYIMDKAGAGVITLLQANNQTLPAGAGSCTKIDPGFVRADYVDPAITAGSLSSLTVQASTITTNTASINSVSATSGSFNSISVSTLTVTSNVNYQPGGFVNKTFLSGGVSNAPVISTDVLVSPYIDTVTYIQPFTNSNVAPGYIVGAVNSGLWGINRIPDPGFVLDVDSTIRTKVMHCSGQLLTSSIVSPSTFCEIKSLTGEVSLTPNPSWFVAVNSGVVAGDTQGKIRFGISETETFGYNGNETYLGTKVYPGYYDSGWTNYVGRPVRVEYSVLLDSSFPSGNGQAEFVLPIGLSTLQSCQLTLVAFGDNNPGLNHPPWLYSTINDANGQISTLQVAGEANLPVFVSALGYV